MNGIESLYYEWDNNIFLVQKILDFRPLTSAEEGQDLNSVPPPVFSLREAPFNYGQVV